MRLFIVTVALIATTACDYAPSHGTRAGSTGDTGSTTGSSSGGGGGGGHGGGSAWSFHSHPCVGNRTDAMWFDDSDTVWVGCGTTTSGTGLFTSVDGGATWDVPHTSPAGAFGAFRVDSISRADDGLLYVGGIDTLGSTRVLSVDDGGRVVEVFSSGGQIWNTFSVGTYRRNSEGVAVAESLTGTEVVARFGDDAPWEDAYGWWGGGESFQILDLTLYDDAFYGVGSTMGQPPMVFLPPKGGQDEPSGFRLTPVQLADYEGELYGVDADAGGVVAAGVDQDRDVGYVFTSAADPYDFGRWNTLDVSSLLPDEPTWMRGACRHEDTVIAVGEFSRRGAGLILRSDDGGASWSDVTPYDEIDLPAVQRCHVFADGTFVVAGAEGTFARYTGK